VSQAIHGVFNLCKPRGLTSYQVVAQVRRLAEERRVGHGGTLDPEATGVLPVCLGQATRLAEYLTELPKAYCAEVRLGVTTDTYDAAGKITGTHSLDHVTLDEVKQALARFTGRIQQLPPMYSAVKQGGRKLYDLARAGQTVEREPRWVEIYRLDLLAWEPPYLTINVECSKGTYIRSLAHDLGQLLGCGAMLQHLVRLRSGPFTLEDSLTLDELRLAFDFGYWSKLIWAMDRIVLHWPAVIVGKEKEEAILRGQSIDLGGDGELQGLSRAYTTDGRFAAILRGSGGPKRWVPHKVFSAAVLPDDEERYAPGLPEPDDTESSRLS